MLLQGRNYFKHETSGVYKIIPARFPLQEIPPSPVSRANDNKRPGSNAGLQKRSVEHGNFTGKRSTAKYFAGAITSRAPREVHGDASDYGAKASPRWLRLPINKYTPANNKRRELCAGRGAVCGAALTQPRCERVARSCLIHDHGGESLETCHCSDCDVSAAGNEYLFRMKIYAVSRRSFYEVDLVIVN